MCAVNKLNAVNIRLEAVQLNNCTMVSDNKTVITEMFQVTDSTGTADLISTYSTDDYFDNFTTVGSNCSSNFVVYNEGIITKEQHETAMFFIFQIFMPIVCSVGFVGNLLSVGVLFHSRDKNAFSTYLKALTLSDTVVLFFGLVQFVSKVMQDYLTDLATFINAWVHLTVNFGIFNFARSLSSLLITVLSIDRFVSVAFPLNIKDFVLEKYPKATIAILLVVEVILRAPTVIWTYVKSYEDCTMNMTIYYLEYRDWSKDPTLRRAFFWFLIVFDMLCPVLIVIVMNMSILVCLKRRPNLTASSKKKETKGAFEQNKILATLMILSLFYILSVLPYMSAYILATLRPDFTLVTKDFYLYSIIIDTNILLVVLNSANDFIIYIISSNRFRALFKRRYSCWVKEGLKREGSSTGQSSTWTMKSSMRKRREVSENSASETVTQVDTE